MKAGYHPSEWVLRVTMPDGSQWDVPVEVIIVNRAAHFAKVDRCDMGAAVEDTIECFRADPFAVTDWAANNMDWADAEARTEKHADPPRCGLSGGLG